MSTLSRKYIVFGLLAGIFIIAGGAAVAAKLDYQNFIWRLDIMYQNPSPLIRRFSPAWRSIKRIGDIVYLPRTLFHSSDLPVYEIILSKTDLNDLLDVLPEMEGGKPFFTEENKQSVKGQFRYGDIDTEARIRYRGVLPNHWNARKKSWQINLPAEYSINGQHALRLFIPEDRWWAAEFLEAERARKFGVLTPRLEFVKLTVNGKDQGVYMHIEGFDRQFLEYNNRTVGEIFSEVDLADRIDYLRLDSIHQWQPRIHQGETAPASQDALAYFLYVISETNDAEFARRIPSILDMDKFYGWALEVLLARNYHQKNEGNLNFYFDPSRGLFEPIAYDMFSRELGDTFEVADNRLLNRIMKHEPFRKEFEARVRTYVNDPANLQRDLAYYEKITNDIKYDIMADSAKLPPTSLFFSHYELHREEITRNFEHVRAWLADPKASLPLTTAEESYPLTGKAASFSSFDAITATPRSFVIQNPPFYLMSSNTIALGPGAIKLSKTVIIPKNTRLVIQAGTHLRLEKDVSIVSYSPLQAEGTAARPITFSPANQWRPWGVFAVVGAAQENKLSHVTISGGSQATINGISFTQKNIDASLAVIE